MALQSLRNSAVTLKTVASTAIVRDPLIQCLAPRLSRSMATEAPLQHFNGGALDGTDQMVSWASTPPRRPPPPIPEVLTTVYKFPTMEPLRFAYYPATHLHLPLRRDILHRAVIFEGDAKRQGTASTKWRDDVHGSGRKIRPQKGSGKARLGDKKSPMLRGGGVAFGPHPRDFSTKLPRKIYDLAWRTALSYRYRKGELIVVDNQLDLEQNWRGWINKIMKVNHWGNPDGRSLFVTRDRRPTLVQAMRKAGEHGRVKVEDDVDVKGLLELGRIIIEKRALDSIIREHSSDLNRTVASAVR